MSLKELIHTEYETREIEALTERIKEVHNPSIANIEPIADDMIDVLHNDEEFQPIHNKKTIIMGALQELFIKKNTDISYKLYTLNKIHAHEEHIDKKLYKELAHKQKSHCCRKSNTSCIIS